MNDRKAILSSDDSPLRTGESLWSSEGQFQLILQSDGNLVLYCAEKPGEPQALWYTGVQGPGEYTLTVSRAGDVILSRGDIPLWRSGTAQAGIDATHYLRVQDDRNVVLYRRDSTGNRMNVWSRLQGPNKVQSMEVGQPSAAAGKGLFDVLFDVAAAVVEHKIKEALQSNAPAAKRPSDATARALEAIDEAHNKQQLANMMLDHIRRR
jgi:hypothetical protein